MGKVSTWNTDACLSVEVAFDAETGEYIDVDGKALPESVVNELKPLFEGVAADDIYAELVIDFNSKGYYDPGCTYGDPSRCYPPEGDDERTLNEVLIDLHNDEKPKIMSEKAANDLFEAYYDEIEAKEVDTSPDEPDYERDDF